MVFKRMREKREKRELELRQRALADATEQWKSEKQALESEIDSLFNYEDVFDEYRDDFPIITKRGEEGILTVRGAALTETRRKRATYQGGSSGFSFRIAKGVSYRVGGHRGTITPSAEQVTLIDGADSSGVFVVTNRRGLFRGSLYNREFRWDKLIAVAVEDFSEGVAVIQLPVENRVKTSGILVPKEHLPLVHSRIKFGVALYRGMEDRHLESLQKELAELERERPRLEDIAPDGQFTIDGTWSRAYQGTDFRSEA